jgi:hypothetical protein
VPVPVESVKKHAEVLLITFKNVNVIELKADQAKNDLQL